MAYTYEDFETARAGSDVNFSQYDLDLAKQYPEFGMSVLNLKKQYAAAQTPEQRALINAQANELRKNYGNYSGGADGAALSGARFPMSFCAMSAKRLISSGLDSTALSRSSSSLIFRFRAGRAFPQGLCPRSLRGSA